MTPRHPLEAEKQFERRHLIRVRLSRVSRTLQPLTLRQFPLVTFKILGGRPLFLLLFCYSSSFSSNSSFHPSTTLAYSHGWQSVAKRRGMSQKRDKRLTLPARELQLETWNFVENEPRIRRDDFPSTSPRSDKGNADLTVFRANSFKGSDMAKVISFFTVCISIACENFVLEKIRIWNSNVPNRVSIIRTLRKGKREGD